MSDDNKYTDDMTQREAAIRDATYILKSIETQPENVSMADVYELAEYILKGKRTGNDIFEANKEVFEEFGKDDYADVAVDAKHADAMIGMIGYIESKLSSSAHQGKYLLVGVRSNSIPSKAGDYIHMIGEKE